MRKILISACFLGKKVRYDADSKTLFHPLIILWQSQNRLISICPEVEGGLPIPRPPAEIQNYSNSNNNIIMTSTGVDVSQAFKKGAQQALQLCQQQHIEFALLKESSPSCGNHFIYDGSFSNKKIVGQGVTTQLLQQHGIKVFSEDNIEVLAQALDQYD
ncbi:MAG: hypothetical protein COB35_11180 [Gammaproteobacteria bacterium]|nr:MAG: hypothetical protein COB35_11180 [Gammaproteobacteria bacterium]